VHPFVSTISKPTAEQNVVSCVSPLMSVARGASHNSARPQLNLCYLGCMSASIRSFQYIAI
jgi:hypothetical protein